MEVVLPVKVEIPSLRVIMETKVSEAEWVQNRFDTLNLIKEKRMVTLCHGLLYQKRIKNTFDKKVKPRELREGDLVLRKIMSFNTNSGASGLPTLKAHMLSRKPSLAVH